MTGLIECVRSAHPQFLRYQGHFVGLKALSGKILSRCTSRLATTRSKEQHLYLYAFLTVTTPPIKGSLKLERPASTATRPIFDTLIFYTLRVYM